MFPRRDDYRVAILCALPVDLDAARVMLDDEYKQPPSTEEYRPRTHGGDLNTYTFGRIHQHNVVLTCLPSGCHGATTASSVAADLLQSFPNIHSCLIVGIGGGIPKEHDIRLGDVIVSHPNENCGGIIQHDLGRCQCDTGQQDIGDKCDAMRYLCDKHSSKQDSNFPCFKWNNPAILDWQRHHLDPENNDHVWYSARWQDNVRQSKNVRKACEENNCQSWIQKASKSRIHNNLLNGDIQLTKHISHQNESMENANILGLEMEAAGLMDNASCLIVRGVCDYTDSHKSNDWSSRAALTAASFGRELCLHLPANVEHEQQSLYDNLRNLCAGTTVGKEQPHDCSALPEDPSHSSRVRAGTGSEGRWVTEDDKHAKSFITFDSKKALAADSSNEDLASTILLGLGVPHDLWRLGAAYMVSGALYLNSSVASDTCDTVVTYFFRDMSRTREDQTWAKQDPANCDYIFVVQLLLVMTYWSLKSSFVWNSINRQRRLQYAFWTVVAVLLGGVLLRYDPGILAVCLLPIGLNLAMSVCAVQERISMKTTSWSR